MLLRGRRRKRRRSADAAILRIIIMRTVGA